MGVAAEAVTPAALDKRSKDVESLTPGHYGDMIAVESNPLEDVSVHERAEHVIKGGILVR